MSSDKTISRRPKPGAPAPQVKTMRKEKKRAPMRILQPGEVNEFWETVLRMRDTGDPRWTKTFSASFKMTAEAYERNRDKERKQAA